MLYGETGAEPVSDEQLTAFLAQNSAEGRGRAAAHGRHRQWFLPRQRRHRPDQGRGRTAETDVENGDTLEAAAAKALPGVLSLLGTTYTDGMLGQYVGSYTFLASDLDYYGDTVKSAILGAQPGQVTAVEMGLSMMVFQAGEKPTAQSLTANDRRAALAEMKGDALDEQLAQLGAQLTHSLDESAMKYYNPKKHCRKLRGICMNITVYLGAFGGSDPAFAAAVDELGAWIGKNGHSLVYGGSGNRADGPPGPERLGRRGRSDRRGAPLFVEQEVQCDQLTRLIVTEDMPQRKAKMIELGQAFIAMPGGTGTLEEISEVMSLVSLKKAERPCILYNLDGYYDSLKALLSRMIAAGLSTPERQKGIYFARSLAEIEEILARD